jgi:hypothetical protein
MKSLIDLRATALALVLAVAAALPAITTSIVRRDYYLFNVTLTSTAPGTTQLFWDLGRGYNEDDSSRQPLNIEPQPVIYRYMMPMGDFKALRLDPNDGVGTFTFSHAEIVNYRNKVVRSFKPSDFKSFSQIARLEVQGDTLVVQTTPGARDPILELELSTPLHLPSDPWIWFHEGIPIAGPVFLFGFLLGLPAVAIRLSGFAGRIAAIARPHPALTLGLVAAAVVAVQCHPVIFQGRSFVSPNNGGHMLYEGLPALPGDTDPMGTNTGSSDTGALLFQHLYYPMVQRDALAAGELPLWNRWSLCGEPLLGQGQSMFGDPFNFITIAANGAAWAWDLRFVLARWLLAVALGGTVWQLTRHLGAASLTTAAGGFLGFFTYRVCHPANFSVCYAPLILLAWTGLQTAPTPRRIATWLAALVGANWLVLTSGTVKEAYMLILGLNFAGVLLLMLRRECADRRGFLFGWAAAAGFGFILLSAPGWISFLGAWSHSMTGYDTPRADTLPWSHLIGFFDDIFYRQTQTDERVVAPALSFIFLAGFLWWLVQPRAWRGARAGTALLLAALPPFALAFGLLPNDLVVKIPFVANIIHVGNTFSCVLLSLIGVIAGLGFRDAWSRLGEPAARPVVFRFWAAALLLMFLYFLTARQFPKSPFFTGYVWSMGLALAALPLGLHWGRLKPALPGPLWVVLVLGLPLLCWRHSQYRETDFNRYAFTPGPRSDLHAVSPAATIVDTQRREPGRVAGWSSVLYASYNTALRWEGVYGVDAVRSRHYHDLADALGLQRVWNWDWPNRETESHDLIRKYDLYNVTHWLASPRAAEHPIAGLKFLGRADLDVYASPTAWPRAFFTDRIIGYHTAADFAKLLLVGDGRPFAAVQELSDRLALPPNSFAIAADPAGLPAGASWVDRIVKPARDYRFTPNHTAFTVEAPGPGVAVLTETYYLDDFALTVNGKPADYFRVNHAFRGVALPAAGTYEITFRYWPKHFTLALWLGTTGFLLLLAGFVWLWRITPPTNSGACPK